MAKRKILIDCDPGHDDAVALLFAARHLDLVGVTTVHGNNSLENTTRNALAVLELGGVKVPLAAVFTSGIPIRMVGLNITRMTGIEQTDIEQLRGSGRNVAGVIADLLEFYLANQRKHSGITIAPMHDVCAVLPYAYAGLIEYAHARVEIELRGTHTRGMTLCDLRPAALAAGLKRTPPPNALVAIEAGSRDIVERVIETLLSYP